MKFRLHNRKHDDCIDIEEETLEECRAVAKREAERRGWKEDDCWSEQVNG